MEATGFAEWLEEQDLSVADVAHFTGLSCATIYRFLNGEGLHRRTLRELKRFQASRSAPQSAKVADAG